jgi:hypothetical protein
MMMTVTFDRPWTEQSEEVKNAISEEAYNKVAEIMGFNIKSRKNSFEKFLTNIAKYGILRP